MSKKGIGFWFSLIVAGNTIQKLGTMTTKPLFETYKYSNPFTMPRLQHPFFGNTFNHHTSMVKRHDIGTYYVDAIQNTIRDYENIELVPVGTNIGSSTITMKFIPLNNIKRSFNLQKQIKYAVANENARVYSDGNKIIVEVPYKGEKVWFGDFMYDKNYRLNKSKTEVPIGQNEKGENIYGDIAKMPHMLVAGTTGSGKSVFLNGVITSLLMKNSPNDIRLILIDPKMVEFSRFEPLKYVKYVSETSEAIGILSQLCKEMDKRYAILAQKGCRDIDDYNKTFPNNPMQRIVLVVDEMADMMEGAYRKQVESNIVRLAQKARASGIHMILATQRPTVKVMSGQIKANIPCRVALAVMSRTDSMVILDKVGAELLNGHGDMLYLDGMSNKEPVRLQGGLITKDDMNNVIMQLVKENEPDVWDKYYDVESLPEARKNEFYEYYGK